MTVVHANPVQPGNETQGPRWNGRAGCAWADAQDALDRMFRPFEKLLVEEVTGAAASRVLDVGCGAGSTTLAVARAVGSEGCTGVDISEPLLSAARARAERERVPVHFIRADAETHPFAPGSAEIVISRFGVMFFADPVRAFVNLRRAATTDGILRAIAWRSPAENPFMTTAERAAAPLLPNLTVRRPDGAGQFAFADARRVETILRDAGWAEIDIAPIDVACTVPEHELDRYVTRMGPVGSALQDVDETTRAQVTGVVRAAFAPYVHGDDVRFTAACWMITARAR